jgi:hypothetical protein
MENHAIKCVPKFHATHTHTQQFSFFKRRWFVLGYYSTAGRLLASTSGLLGLLSYHSFEERRSLSPLPAQFDAVRSTYSSLYEHNMSHAFLVAKTKTITTGTDKTLRDCTGDPTTSRLASSNIRTVACL